MMYKKMMAFLYIGLIIGCFFMSQYVMVFLFIVFFGKEAVLQMQYLTVLLSYLLFFLVLCGIDKVYPTKKNIEKSELEIKGIGEVFRFIFYGIGLWGVSTLINALLLPLFPEYASQMGSLFESKEMILCFLTLVIGGPIIEEYLFRGKVQGVLNEIMGDKLAIVFQGIIFGFVHPFGLQRIYASVIGVGFGYIRQREKRLIAPIIMHITINFIGWVMGMATAFM